MLRFLPNFCTKSKLNIRTLQCRKFSDKALDKNVKEIPEVQGKNTNVLTGKVHSPRMWHRIVLVWSGVYKSKEDIPNNVPYEAIDKAKNIVRIKISNYMILATIVACIIFAIRGRRAAERGETISKMNLDWHKKIKEDAEKENQSR
ncbi:hypothetical protein O3M35_007406 [Rhynocoris fuscipes]|uniref:Protein FAM162A n=1 Tax=Rhynocoris fuscipes TaxID=488301 RepID=A0AAW1DCY4_9HEMI